MNPSLVKSAAETINSALVTTDQNSRDVFYYSIMGGLSLDIQLYRQLIQSGKTKNNHRLAADQLQVIVEENLSPAKDGCDVSQLDLGTGQIVINANSVFQACWDNETVGANHLRERFRIYLLMVLSEAGGRWQVNQRHRWLGFERLAGRFVLMLVFVLMLLKLFVLGLNLLTMVVETMGGYFGVYGQIFFAVTSAYIVAVVLWRNIGSIGAWMWKVARGFSDYYCYEERYVRGFVQQAQLDPEWQKVIQLTD